MNFKLLVSSIGLPLVAAGNVALAEPLQLNFTATIDEGAEEAAVYFPEAIFSGAFHYDSEASADFVEPGEGFAYFFGEGVASLFIGQFNDSLALDYISKPINNSGLYAEVNSSFEVQGNTFEFLYLDLYNEFGDPIFSGDSNGLPTGIVNAPSENSPVFGSLYFGNNNELDMFLPLTFSSFSFGTGLPDYPAPVVDGNNNVRLGGVGLPDGARLNDGDFLSTTITTAGFTAFGEFIQTGGDHLADELQVGGDSENFDTADGRYELTGGQLVTDVSNVGLYGTGEFVQSGGSHETRTLFLGNVGQNSAISGTRAIGKGTYAMMDGVLTVRNAVIGASGQGTVNQSGGEVNIGNEFAPTSTFNYLTIGISTSRYDSDALGVPESERPFGEYNLSAGILNVSGSTRVGRGTDVVGRIEAGQGRVNQTGGTFITHDLTIGSEGTAASGRGTVTVSGGTLDASGTINVGTVSGGMPAAEASFVQSGGSVSARNVTIGEGKAGNPNAMRILGGTTTVSNGVTVGTVGPSAGTAILEVSSGGSLFGDVNVLEDGALIGDGGSIFGNVTVNGGTLAPGLSPGTMNISGDLIINAGIFSLEFFSDTVFDQLNVAGNVQLGADATIELALSSLPTGSLAFEDFFSIGGALTIEAGFDPLTQFMVSLGDGFEPPRGSSLTFSFEGQSYSYAVSSVPLPAGLWLLLAPMTMLVRMPRRAV